MKKSSTEIVVGIFVLLGFACIAYLTIQLGQMQWFGDDSYRLEARFSSASGLKVGGVVDIAGVEVGRVGDIVLDTSEMVAVVGMKIRRSVRVDDEASAAIKTNGLIGDKYIRLAPGGGEEFLAEGDSIVDTESAVDVEDMIGKYAFGEAE